MGCGHFRRWRDQLHWQHAISIAVAFYERHAAQRAVRLMRQIVHNSTIQTQHAWLAASYILLRSFALLRAETRLRGWVEVRQGIRIRQHVLSPHSCPSNEQRVSYFVAG